MDKLDYTEASKVLDVVLSKVEDTRMRFTISMYRHKECGENRELCRKIYKICHLLYEKNPEMARIIVKRLEPDYIVPVKFDEKGYEIDACIPYSTSIESKIEYIINQCYQFISPLKKSFDKPISELAQAIEEDIENIPDDIEDYINKEPFSISFNPYEYLDPREYYHGEIIPIGCDIEDDKERDYWKYRELLQEIIDGDVDDDDDDDEDDEDDVEKRGTVYRKPPIPFPYFADDVWTLERYSALFFFYALTLNEDKCAILLEMLKNSEVFEYNFRTNYYATATDAYNLAKQLPRTFIRAFFRFYENNHPIKYNRLISLLELGEEKEFVILFQNTYLDRFIYHHYFLCLVLDYFAIFSRQSNKFPNLKEYLYNDYPYSSYAEEMHKIVIKFSRMFDKDSTVYIPEITRTLHFDDQSDSNNIKENNQQKVLTENNLDNIVGQLVKKDIPHYISRNGIHKKFDVAELVKHLTSINEFTDTIFVEKGDNNEYDVEDCLTYFFNPYNETIRTKLYEKSFTPYFKLEWKGRHAVSLRCLVRLLLNADTEKWTKALDVFDSSGEEDDRLSRDYVSVQDDKSPIWKPVIEVFSKKAIYNAGIDKSASSKTIEANEKEIKEIINIVFACKKPQIKTSQQQNKGN